ncbi:MAG: hypothetical protein AB7J73_00925 [Gammaproteobacteria bacterium]
MRSLLLIFGLIATFSTSAALFEVTADAVLEDSNFLPSVFSNGDSARLVFRIDTTAPDLSPASDVYLMRPQTDWSLSFSALSVFGSGNLALGFIGPTVWGFTGASEASSQLGGWSGQTSIKVHGEDRPNGFLGIVNSLDAYFRTISFEVSPGRSFSSPNDALLAIIADGFADATLILTVSTLNDPGSSIAFYKATVESVMAKEVLNVETPDTQALLAAGILGLTFLRNREGKLRGSV